MDAQRDGGLRHSFIVIIPVADRPQHLGNILASLLELCRTFDYPQTDDDGYANISVVVADDSADSEAIRRHQELAQDYSVRGLATRHFGTEAQAQLLHDMSPAQRDSLRHVIGDLPENGFHHKGASVTRNLASLLACHLKAEDACLFMFVDSDEQFKVRIAGPDATADADVFAIDYFRCLDAIFSADNVDVLTGKVVGDPPVSPAVMAGNFLGDIVGLLEQMAAAGPGQACGFHGELRLASDAAYHDMADLFGFAAEASPFSYRCTLGGKHDHAHCLADFSAKLDHFFDGEHPTRVSYYVPAGACTATQPARTVYTGNYVCTRRALRHFIPFAPLKLRMAGPVLGRLIRAEIGPRFVSANLPLLHTRTPLGNAGFRPGVSRDVAKVDLSGEFERQFYGDVMLFGIERLVAEQGFPGRTVPAPDIHDTLDQTERMLRARYADKRSLIQTRLERAAGLFDQPAAWWHGHPALAPCRANFHRFFDNIRRNFSADSPAFQRMAASAHRSRQLAAMSAAISRHADDSAAWQAALEATP